MLTNKGVIYMDVNLHAWHAHYICSLCIPVDYELTDVEPRMRLETV